VVIGGDLSSVLTVTVARLLAAYTKSGHSLSKIQTQLFGLIVVHEGPPMTVRPTMEESVEKIAGKIAAAVFDD
jgi:hypothetical protein